MRSKHFLTANNNNDKHLKKLLFWFFFLIWEIHLQLIFLELNYTGIFYLPQLTEAPVGAFGKGRYAGPSTRGRSVPTSAVFWWVSIHREWACTHYAYTVILCRSLTLFTMFINAIPYKMYLDLKKSMTLYKSLWRNLCKWSELKKLRKPKCENRWFQDD